MQQFPRYQQYAVSEVGKIRVNAEFPGVAEGANLFGFSRQIFIFAVSDIAVGDESLKIRSVPDTVGRIEVDQSALARRDLPFPTGCS